MRSLNFEFLKPHEPLLAQLGAAAERYCFEDPNVSLYKLRQFGELLAQMAARRVGLSVSSDANQMTLAKSIEQSEEEKQQIQAKLTALETQAQAIPAPKLQSLVNRAADTLIDLDEAATRRLIDQQLRDAGWNADSEILEYGQGTRPEKERNLVIAEYPIGPRFADYVLFIGLQPVAVIEAKRWHTNVQSGALDQAIERYAEKFPGGPLPFAFATNGKPFQAQIKSKSGIWFQDLRQEMERSRAIGSWFRPEELQRMLGQDLDAAEAKLKNTEFANSVELYDFQKAAITAVETAIVEDKREVMLAMATGTGKTRTAIALCYRLLQTNRFRRILFLVDRSIDSGEANGREVSGNQRHADPAVYRCV
jgi:type I restriction enzyme, R subunit